MTREIKFRVWNKKSKYFASITEDMDYQAGFDDKASLYIIDNGDPDENNQKFLIQQSTGLLDKKGKEIFEGDIVNFGVDLDCVIFSFGAFHLEKMSSCYCRHVLVSECNHEIEIIGNIYENPELLEDKND